MEQLKRYRLVIAGVALLAMVGISWWAISTRTGDTPDVESDTPTLPEIERDRITEIEIRRPGEGEAPIRLVKQGTAWRLAAPVEAPAAQTVVETALEKLADLEVVGIAASRRQHHERLEVDAEHGVRVIARAGTEELIDFWIGSNPSGSNTMIRVDGQEQVLSVRGAIKFAFNKPARDWRDRAIVELEPNDVREVTFVNTNGTFRFRKAEAAWEQVLEAPEGQPAPAAIERFAPTKVATNVSTIARLRAADFAAPDVTAESAGLGDAAARVTLVSGEGEEAQTTVIRIGNEAADSQRYVMREGNDTIFLVASHQVERLMPNGAAFQEPEPGTTPPEEPAAEGGDPHGGMPPGGIPPEIMQQLQQQLQQRGATN